jgi:hypothetical protein
MAKWHKYTETEIEFIKLYADQGYTYDGIKNAFNEHFNANLTLYQIKSTMGRYSIKNNVDSKFKKGMVAYNKGKKMSPEVYEKIKPTLFKKGHNINTRPVGSERIDKDGYIEIKVAMPDKWKLKHIEVWESQHGNVPKNHCVIFLDGDKRNFDINNLALITRAENLYLNKSKLRFNDKDITQSAVNIAKLNSKIRERR